MTLKQDRARQQIETLISLYRSLDERQRKLTSESSVVHQFIDPLFDALGWPIHDPARYQYEIYTGAGRPDMRLTPEDGGVVYVEAKRFGVIGPLEQARRKLDPVLTPSEMGLSGMAIDRTPEEQQAINYAFQNGGHWAILTNFERLRLFNARRDWLVLSFEEPSAYLEEFDLLWQLSYERINQGGLDILSDQRHREDVDTDYLRFINEWREKLAQDIVANKAANPWVVGEDGKIRVAELRAVVQRILDRLVVVRFAEDHMVVRPGTLQSIHDLRELTPYTFSLTEFYSRLYRVFDEKHNSGLFTLGLADAAVISDEVLSGLTQKLYEARYRAMSADIMGNTYERYLGKALRQEGDTVVTTDNLETRKKQGSYYTPQVIVRHLVDNSLGRYLYGTTNGKQDGEPLTGEKRKTAAEIRDLRVIDPACGSGSFLIYAYQVLADFYRAEISRLEGERDAKLQELISDGVETPFDLQVELAPLRMQIGQLQNYPTYILENHLYGVDLDPQAAEIATVNLIMRAMADMPRKDQRLPLILSQNVKVGNSLIGAGPEDERYAEHASALAEIRRLRIKLANESENDPGHPSLARIDELSTEVNSALNDELPVELGDPGRHMPFNWVVEFPEVFVNSDGNVDGKEGFTVVVGNPPWEVVKPDRKEYYAQFDPLIESKLTAAQVEKRIEELDAEDLGIATGWRVQKQRIEETARYFNIAPSYAKQGRGDRATYKLFVERGFRLLSAFGRLGYVLPAGIYSDAGARDLRLMLLDEGSIEYMHCLSNERWFFEDVHHAFKFALLGVQKGTESNGFWVSFRINPRVAIAPEELPQHVANKAEQLFMRRESLSRFDPKNQTVMEFQSAQAYEIADRLYDLAPQIGDDDADWNPQFGQEFHMSGDSDIFNQHGVGFPLYEGKMIHQFDPFFAEPRYWVNEKMGVDRLGNSKARDWYKDYRLAFREVSGGENERTCIACILSPSTFSGHTLWVGVMPTPEKMLYLCGVLNSFVADWVLRLKVNFHVTLSIMKQLPLPRLEAGDPYFDAIVHRTLKLSCVHPDYAALWQSISGETWTTTSVATDSQARQLLRDELDAIVAHLYGLTRDDFEHILGGFPLVFPDNEKGHRRKASLLSVYDRFDGELLRD